MILVPKAVEMSEMSNKRTEGPWILWDVLGDFDRSNQWGNKDKKSRQEGWRNSGRWGRPRWWLLTHVPSNFAVPGSMCFSTSWLTLWAKRHVTNVHTSLTRTQEDALDACPVYTPYIQCIPWLEQWPQETRMNVWDRIDSTLTLYIFLLERCSLRGPPLQLTTMIKEQNTQSAKNL